MCKIMKDKYDSKVSQFIRTKEIEGQEYQLRGHYKTIQYQYCRTNTRRNSFALRSTTIWNSLPDAIVNSPNVSMFKNRLDAHWKNLELRYNFKAKM